MNRLSRLLCVLLVAVLLSVVLAGCSPPLTMSVTKPRDGATVKTSPAKLTGSVSNDKATVTVNGAAVVVKQYGSFETTVPLAEGENTITIVATHRDKTVTKTIKVTYVPRAE